MGLLRGYYHCPYSVLSTSGVIWKVVDFSECFLSAGCTLPNSVKAKSTSFCQKLGSLDIFWVLHFRAIRLNLPDRPHGLQ